MTHWERRELADPLRPDTGTQRPVLHLGLGQASPPAAQGRSNAGVAGQTNCAGNTRNRLQGTLHTRGATLFYFTTTLVKWQRVFFFTRFHDLEWGVVYWLAGLHGC